MRKDSIEGEQTVYNEGHNMLATRLNFGDTHLMKMDPVVSKTFRGGCLQLKLKDGDLLILNRML